MILWEITGSGTITQSDFLQHLMTIKDKITIATPAKKTKNPTKVYEVPCAFDIEASSWIDTSETKRATMYAWAFGLGDKVTTGRTWEEFVIFIASVATILKTNNKLKLYCYVHNLAYDFQFFRKWFKWEKVFLLDKNVPVYALSTLGIEFRCSYKLSNRSLAAVGNELQKYKVKKLLGDLDYSLVRTSKTLLTEKEWGYIENDIRVVLAYIQEKIEHEGIMNIPLTNTGYVRNRCREECFKNYKKYTSIIQQLSLEPEEYLQLRAAFAGGFTHGNSYMRGWTFHDVASYDFTSSYPAVMLYEKYPMSKGEKANEVKTIEDVKRYSKNYCLVFTIFFDMVVSKFKYEHIISKSKCNKEKLTEQIVDNGRIVTARNVELTITEQDLLAILDFYDVIGGTVTNCWVYVKSYLPISFMKSIMQFYKDKTMLKGNKDKLLEYMISKNMLNSTYGMCVTDIIRDILEYDDDYKEPQSPNLEEEIEKYNTKKNRFLSYAWGVWVTAYARRNLWKAILYLGKDYLYSDTDSVKFRNYNNHMKYFEEYNNQMYGKWQRRIFILQKMIMHRVEYSLDFGILKEYTDVSSF